MATAKSKQPQYQSNFLWTVVSPILALLAAVPLSVAIVTHIIHDEFATSVAALRTTQLAAAPVAGVTPVATENCVGATTSNEVTAATPTVQTASTNPAPSLTEQLTSPTYTKKYTTINNSYNTDNSVTKTWVNNTVNSNNVTGSFNKGITNVNSGNKTETNVTTVNHNTASDGSVINNQPSTNVTTNNGGNNITSNDNSPSSALNNNKTTTTTEITNNTIVDSNNGNVVDSFNPTINNGQGHHHDHQEGSWS